MGEHLIEGSFQSDKYPGCPRGKVPLSEKDPLAQDLLAEYARRRRPTDQAFADDLMQALRNHGYEPSARSAVPTAVVETTIASFEVRRRRLLERLRADHPEVFEEQLHTREGTTASIYWHYGYMVALADMLNLLCGEEWVKVQGRATVTLNPKVVAWTITDPNVGDPPGPPPSKRPVHRPVRFWERASAVFGVMCAGWMFFLVAAAPNPSSWRFWTPLLIGVCGLVQPAVVAVRLALAWRARRRSAIRTVWNLTQAMKKAGWTFKSSRD